MERYASRESPVQDVEVRVVRALGQEPIPDARHLLPPIVAQDGTPRPWMRKPEEGPTIETEFVIDLVGRYPVSLEALYTAFPATERGGLAFVRFWVQPEQRGANKSRHNVPPTQRWVPLDSEETDGTFLAQRTFLRVALAWELASLLSEGAEAATELAGYVLRANERAERLGLTAVPREVPADAAKRATKLIDRNLQLAKPVEMRLLPQGRSFPSRQVWRCAYALGLIWGDFNLLHWYNPVPDTKTLRPGQSASNTDQPLFTLSSLGHPGYFLPERAAEGECIPGIALSFELPMNPYPLETYDRMGMALNYLRQHLSGRPQTRDGAELDTDRLYEDRDVLEKVLHIG